MLILGTLQLIEWLILRCNDASCLQAEENWVNLQKRKGQLKGSNDLLRDVAKKYARKMHWDEETLLDILEDEMDWDVMYGEDDDDIDLVENSEPVQGSGSQVRLFPHLPL